MLAQAAVQQAAANPEDHADDIGYPVVDFSAAVEAGLDEFNGAPEDTRSDENRQKSEAARASEREGERREGDEVYELVTALRRWGWRLQGPEHCDGQGKRHGDGQRDVEVLAHLLACIWGRKQTQARAAGGYIRGMVERGAKSGAWRF